ncbi:MAG: EGF-like domain [Bacteroidota bacterium]|jgi:hypothetical protein
MKKIKFFAFAVMTALSISTVTYFNSCKKDPCKDVVCNNGGTCVDGTCSCTSGYEGANCETETRSKYVGEYTGNGTDNATPSSSYTSWHFKYSLKGTVASDMTMDIQDQNRTFTLSMPIVLNSASTGFTITSTTNGGFTYTGSGTISASTSAVTLIEHDNTANTTLTYTFSNLVR